MKEKKFIFKETAIKGLLTAERRVSEDERGEFSKVFSSDEFKFAGINKPLAQVNFSYNRRKGTLRGMHFQHPPFCETRIVSCLKGEVFDVAVDLRRGSETFLCWHAQKLSRVNRISLIIPEGFAHGFQTLDDDCELLYFHTGFYSPGSEGGFKADDPKIAIEWPLPVSCVSFRDGALPGVSDDFKGVEL